MFDHTRNQMVHPAPGAEDARQQMEICYASSSEKYTLLLEIRKTSGSCVEPLSLSFWGECSNKGFSIQHLRPNIHPIYQKGRVVSPNLPISQNLQQADRLARDGGFCPLEGCACPPLLHFGKAELDHIFSRSFDTGALVSFGLLQSHEPLGLTALPEV